MRWYGTADPRKLKEDLTFLHVTPGCLNYQSLLRLYHFLLAPPLFLILLCEWLRWPSPKGPWSLLASKMSLRRGWRKVILKAHYPPTTLGFFLLLQPITVVPTLGPLDLNFLSLCCFSTRLSCAGFFPSSSLTVTATFKEALASPPKQSYLSPVTLSLAWFYFLHSTRLGFVFMCTVFSPD